MMAEYTSETQVVPGMVSQYLTFLINNEVFGIEVSSVKEILEYQQIHLVPGVPDYIRGVINLRGDIIPVIDLSVRLYGVRMPLERNSNIVVVEFDDDGQRTLLGAVIDSVKEVLDIPESSIVQTPEFGSRIREDFIKGIANEDVLFTVILDIEQVLDIDELSDYEAGIHQPVAV